MKTTTGKILRNVIKGINQIYVIREITIIDGHDIPYSGEYDNFGKNCDINMLLYRNALLKREVEAHKVIKDKLFVFLKEDES